MEQKGSKVQEARKLQKSKSGPKSSHSGADFDTDKEPLARQFSGPESACSGADFEAQENIEFDINRAPNGRVWACNALVVIIYFDLF